jgi:hypothetical protein
LDIASSSLVYRDIRVVLASEEFIVLASVAAGRGEFVSFESVADTVLGESQTEDSVRCVMAWVTAIHSSLWSMGISEEIIEVDLRAGLRLAGSFGF